MSWNDLTDRQKQLDKLIDSCGIKLNASRDCVEKVAQTIGATSNEVDFVQQRIELRLRTVALLDKTDTLTSATEHRLNQFEKDDEEWRKRGRDLGSNF